MKDAYMNLSFYQMWYFIRTIELGSYSRASQDLNVTQSTLSKCIQNIEQNLKMELFIREKNNLIPTEAAKNLYQVWKKMIVEMQEAVEDAPEVPFLSHWRLQSPKRSPRTRPVPVPMLLYLVCHLLASVSPQTLPRRFSLPSPSRSSSPFHSSAYRRWARDSVP